MRKSLVHYPLCSRIQNLKPYQKYFLLWQGSKKGRRQFYFLKKSINLRLIVYHLVLRISKGQRNKESSSIRRRYRTSNHLLNGKRGRIKQNRWDLLKCKSKTWRRNSFSFGKRLNDGIQIVFYRLWLVREKFA